ncbi:hypothetical protein [Variovorax sp. KK3]|uniref:hypothetical protein n=1 Tax=Variovorax sp. KK3 TaxID=1855728 RepID=UPI0015C2CCF2|nr:hypothetical protein [Variovorax sp. KK3]
MNRQPDPRHAEKRRADLSHAHLPHDHDSPVPTRPAEEGEAQQSPGAKPLVKKQQQQH